MATKKKASQRPKQQPRRKRDMLAFCENLWDDICMLSDRPARRIVQEQVAKLTEEELREYDELTRPLGRFPRFPFEVMKRDKLAPSQEERSRQKRYMRAFCKKLWADMKKMASGFEANELRSSRLGQLSSHQMHDYFEIEKARDKLLSFHIELSL